MKLAMQVLSQSVANALEESGDNDVLETAKFCRMMNSFFDCTNVRSRTEHIHKKNEFIKPYTSLNDERFSTLEKGITSLMQKIRCLITTNIRRPQNFCTFPR